jgi:hypothetical protein
MPQRPNNKPRRCSTVYLVVRECGDNLVRILVQKRTRKDAERWLEHTKQESGKIRIIERTCFEQHPFNRPPERKN